MQVRGWEGGAKQIFGIFSNSAGQRKMTRGRKRELLKSFKIDSVPQWFDDDESVHRYDDLYSIYILYIYIWRNNWGLMIRKWSTLLYQISRFDILSAFPIYIKGGLCAF